MSLPAGTTLGPYAIDGPLGAGGMGEVYRARDTRLGREVAVKVIAADSATDADRLARFEQEARAAAALNHPNILAVFDIGPGSAEYGPYIVSELLEGETLGARIARGRLPVRTAIELATQVARALAAAHDKGIVHRDLKPDNIFVTRDGTAKVLDFGLAKLRETAPGVSGDASTVTGRPPTAQGAVMGTVGYMAPEQVRGVEVDHRADIFAIGVTLYEMLSGQRAFRGDSAVETLNAILKSEPAEFETLGVPVPAEVARIVAHCVEKHPADRFQSARDLAFHLSGAAGTDTRGSASAPTAHATRWSRERLLWSAITTVAFLTSGYLWLRPPTSATPTAPAVPTYSHLNPPGGVADAFHRGFALSPNGRTLAFPGTDDTGRTLLWLRDMSTGEQAPVASTDDAQHPFWSPDGADVAFEARGRLWRYRSGSAAPQSIATAFAISADFRGGAWRPDGTIVFAGALSPMFAVAAEGGIPAIYADGSRVPGASRFAWPVAADTSLLASVLHDQEDRSGIYVFGGSPAEPRLVMPWKETVTSVRWDPAGVMLHRVDGGTTLIGTGFEPDWSRSTGAHPIAPAVQVAQSWSNFSISDTGRMVLRSPADAPPEVVLSRAGDVVGQLEIGPSNFTDVANDGRLLMTPANDLWLFDPATRVNTRLTTSRDVESFPSWSPDGSAALYHTDFGARHHIIELTSRQTTTIDHGQVRWDHPHWDGRRIVASVRDAAALGAPTDLWMYDVSSEVRTQLTQTPASETYPRLDPSGRFLAFVSDETGRPEVFVMALPTGVRRQVSTAGGRKVWWTRGGAEIIYAGADGSVLATSFEAPGSTGRPVRLFKVSIAMNFADAPYVTPSPDGSRFIIRPRAPRPLVLIDNWRALLNR